MLDSIKLLCLRIIVLKFSKQLYVIFNVVMFNIFRYGWFMPKRQFTKLKKNLTYFCEYLGKNAG